MILPSKYFLFIFQDIISYIFRIKKLTINKITSKMLWKFSYCIKTFILFNCNFIYRSVLYYKKRKNSILDLE